MWMGTKTVVDLAASTCPVAAAAPGPAPVALQDCDDFGQLQSLLGPVNEACCTGAVDCSSGMPDICDATCGATLLPFRASCADFLKLPMTNCLTQVFGVWCLPRRRVFKSIGPHNTSKCTQL